MNDYISKSSVCEILSDLYPMDGEKVVPVKEINKAYEKIIQLQYEEPKQQWIPCSERLPDKKRETYWVCTDTEDQCQCRWTNNPFGINNPFEIDESAEWRWSIFDTPQYTKVVAWMPLPEPYKESEE